MNNENIDYCLNVIYHNIKISLWLSNYVLFLTKDFQLNKCQIWVKYDIHSKQIKNLRWKEKKKEGLNKILTSNLVIVFEILIKNFIIKIL